MQRNAAVYRTEKTLQEGCDRIDEVYDSFKDVKITDKGLVWNTDLIETLELENLLGKYFIIQSKLSKLFIQLSTVRNQEELMQEMIIPIEMIKTLWCIPIQLCLILNLEKFILSTEKFIASLLTRKNFLLSHQKREFIDQIA